MAKNDLIVKYSTFKADMIGEVLAKLVKTMEGENYSYQKVEYQTYDYFQTPWDVDIFPTTKYYLMIAKGTAESVHLGDWDKKEMGKSLKNYLEDGALILDGSSYSLGRTIKFYSLVENKLKSLIDFNKYSYVKDFIDLVIDYRITNQKENITSEELMLLADDFIFHNEELAMKNFKKRAKEKLQSLQRELQRKKALIEEQEKAKMLKEKITELEQLMQNGLPSVYNNHLINRLNEEDASLSDAMTKVDIHHFSKLREAKITLGEPCYTSENIFMAKIELESNFEYETEELYTNPDVLIKDSGLIGIVEIASLTNLDDYIKNLKRKGYIVDNYLDKYLRVIYLTKLGHYEDLSKSFKNNYDYRKAIDTSEITKLQGHLKNMELLSRIDEDELKLVRDKKVKLPYSTI